MGKNGNGSHDGRGRGDGNEADGGAGRCGLSENAM